MQVSINFVKAAPSDDTNDPIYGCPCDRGNCDNAEKAWRG